MRPNGLTRLFYINQQGAHMKYLITILFSLVMITSANAVPLQVKTSLNQDDIAWINKHQADETGGSYSGFAWVRIKDHIYSMPTHLFAKNCSFGDKECARELFKTEIKEQYRKDLEAQLDVQQRSAVLFELLIKYGFTQEDADLVVKSVIK